MGVEAVLCHSPHTPLALVDLLPAAAEPFSGNFLEVRIAVLLRHFMASSAPPSAKEILAAAAPVTAGSLLHGDQLE